MSNNGFLENGMKKYLVASQARSVISQLNARYHIFRSGQRLGGFLRRDFGFSAPSFMISGINKASLRRLGIPCHQTPCLFRIMNDRKMTNQFIFGKIFSANNDEMINDFLNLKHLPKLQLDQLIDKINQINHSSCSKLRLVIHGNQLIFVSRLSRTTFVNSIMHLLEVQSAIQRGQTVLDDGTRYFF